MNRLFIPALILLSAICAFAQSAPRQFDFAAEGVRIEPDKRLIVVMASLEAAGLRTPLTGVGEKFREKLKTDIAGLNPELVGKMEYFIKQYKTRHAGASDAELIAPFISMAYTLSPVPELAEPLRETDLPGELLEVLDFSPLIRQMYRSPVRSEQGATTFGQKVEEYFKEYQAEGDKLRPTAAVMIREVLDYLHTRPQTTFVEQRKVEVRSAKGKTTLSKIESRERERRFFIVPDLLSREGTVNFRNIGDDYFAIIPPGTDLSDSEVRRAYLQFVLDPIILGAAKEILEKKEGIRALLEERRKTNPNVPSDVVLAVSRSLVAAADAREGAFRRMNEATSEARRNAGRKPLGESTDALGRKVVKLTDELYLIDGRFSMPGVDDEVAFELSNAYENGAVLSFYFAKQLLGLEDSGFDIASSLRDMVVALDPAKEANRLAENAEARNRAGAAFEARKKTAVVVLDNPVTKRLIEIEPMIEARRYSEAEQALSSLLQSNAGDGRIYYNLGRVKSLSAAETNDVEARNVFFRDAKSMFEAVLKIEDGKVDPALKSLSYVYIARILEHYDQNEYAVRVYDAAIKIGDVKGGGYREALAARERLLKNLK